MHVDLWLCKLTSDLNHALPFLTEEEKARTERFRYSHHQRRFANTRAILRCLLEKYLHIPAKDILIDYGAKGKPFIINDDGLTFNVSHADDLALIGIGKTYPLGVDIACFSNRSYDDIAKQLFSIDEQQALFYETSPNRKASAFFNIWTQKEAFVKVSGLGLQYPTHAFSVPAWPTGPTLVFDIIQGHYLTLKTFQIKQGVVAALCCHPSILNTRFIDWDKYHADLIK